MLNVPPGAIEPEFQLPLFATDVCVTLSLFIHVTVVPTGTLTGFGENAVVVSVDAPATIATGVPLVGDVVDGDDELQAAVRLSAKIRNAKRNLMKPSCLDRRQTYCRVQRRRSPAAQPRSRTGSRRRVTKRGSEFSGTVRLT